MSAVQFFSYKHCFHSCPHPCLFPNRLIYPEVKQWLQIIKNEWKPESACYPFFHRKQGRFVALCQLFWYRHHPKCFPCFLQRSTVPHFQHDRILCSIHGNTSVQSSFERIRGAVWSYSSYILTVTCATVCRLDNMPLRGCCRTSSSSSWPSTCPVDCTGPELHSALSRQEIAVPVHRSSIHRYSRLYHWFLSKMLSEQPFYFPFG